MLPVSASSRWWMRKASRSSGRATPGHRITEPVRVGAVGTRHTQHCPRSRPGPCLRPDNGGCSVRSYAGASRCRQRRGEDPRPPGARAAVAAASPGRTWRRAQVRRASGIEGAVGHLGHRHPAQSSDVPTGTRTAHQVTGLPDDSLVPDRQRCAGRRHQGLQRDWHRRARTDGIDEALQLRALALVLARSTR